MNHFEKQMKQSNRGFWIALVLNLLFLILVVGFISFMAATLLIHYGIVGWE